MNDLRTRTMRPDEIAIAADWAAVEGWNPGLADAACFKRIGELDAPIHFRTTMVFSIV